MKMPGAKPGEYIPYFQFIRGVKRVCVLSYELEAEGS